jgi:hypothetical protein
MGNEKTESKSITELLSAGLCGIGDFGAGLADMGDKPTLLAGVGTFGCRNALSIGVSCISPTWRFETYWQPKDRSAGEGLSLSIGDRGILTLPREVVMGVQGLSAALA